MKNIESAKNAIEAEIGLLESRLKICLQIKEELNNLTLSEEIEMPINSNEQIVHGNSSTQKIDPRQFLDYPFNKRLLDRLKYLDEKFPRAWKMRERLELMVQIEGPATRDRFKNMSQELGNLIKAGVYIGAKYNNDKKTQFYCKPEWISEDEKSIKPEHAPNPESFGTMPEYKRKNELIAWMRG